MLSSQQLEGHNVVHVQNVPVIIKINADSNATIENLWQTLFRTNLNTKTVEELLSKAYLSAAFVWAGNGFLVWDGLSQ